MVLYCVFLCPVFFNFLILEIMIMAFLPSLSPLCFIFYKHCPCCAIVFLIHSHTAPPYFGEVGCSHFSNFPVIGHYDGRYAFVHFFALHFLSDVGATD